MEGANKSNRVGSAYNWNRPRLAWMYRFSIMEVTDKSICGS